MSGQMRKQLSKRTRDLHLIAHSKKHCNCKNSRCLKLYCECFASGRYCHACNCVACCNNQENETFRQAAVETILDRNPNAFRPKIQVRSTAFLGLRHCILACDPKSQVLLTAFINLTFILEHDTNAFRPKIQVRSTAFLGLGHYILACDPRSQNRLTAFMNLTIILYHDTNAFRPKISCS
jgi:hypothetical protein